MRVGVLQFFSWPGRRGDLAEIYRSALERVEVMDRTGYDGVWLAEHHFNDFSVCPSVHMMGVACAERTERLRIGTAVSLVGFAHPLRVAEEAALLDVLSDGRLNFGAGRGADPIEHAVFGVAADESHERFREHLALVLAAWRSERVSHRSERWCFDQVEVLPKPQQQPHPPVWAAASSPGAIDWAASQGFDILMDPHSSHADIGLKLAQYARELRRHGYEPGGRTIPVARLVAVAETDEEAERVARRGATWTVASYANAERGNIGADLRARETQAAGGDGRDPVERYVDDVIVWGSPRRVIDELCRLRDEVTLEYLLAAPLSRRSFELLTDEVLPDILS